MWDLTTGHHTSILEGSESHISSIAWSHNGTRLASVIGPYDHIIKIWDLDTCQCIRTLEFCNPHRHMAWAHDGTRIASAANDQTINIWELSTGQRMSILQAPGGVVRCIAWSYDDIRIASLSGYSIIQIWNPDTGQCVSTLESTSEWYFNWSYDGTRLASRSFREVNIWNPHTGQRRLTLETGVPSGSVDLDNLYKSVLWSRDGTRLASASHERKIEIWDPITGQCISILTGTARLASGSVDSTVRVWDPVTAQCISILRGHSGNVNTVFWSQDGSRLISGSLHGTIKIWDSSADYSLPTYNGHSDRIQFIAWSSDGKRLATGSSDKTVKIWDKYTGKCIWTLTGHERSVESISWSRHPTWLASAADDEIRIWDSFTGQCISTLKDPGDRVICFALSHDGTMLASATDTKDYTNGCRNQIWDPSIGRCIWSRVWDSRVSAISWSYDGTRLAVGGHGKFRILDLVSGKTLTTTRAHREYVLSLSWSRDGAKLASVAFDEAVRIWDPDTAQCIRKLWVVCGWLQFDEVNSSILHTDTGTLDLQSCVPDDAPSTASTGGLVLPRQVGYGLKHDGCWITFDGQDLLWLPPEYRPAHRCLSAISGSTVAIG
ncbi:hypothetical protein N7486_001755, partial [Penicillium sp. IBT 16267x]